jgi:hypothetical protein
MLLNKFLMLLFIVAGAADNIKAGFSQCCAIVPKAQGLCSAARGVVLWVKIQNKLLLGVQV